MILQKETKRTKAAQGEEKHGVDWKKLANLWSGRVSRKGPHGSWARNHVGNVRSNNAPMKTRHFVSLVTALLLSAFSFQFSAFSQGSLTPPGAPAPTMLTLSQIEPRTPISSLPFNITRPGSYY